MMLCYEKKYHKGINRVNHTNISVPSRQKSQKFQGHKNGRILGVFKEQEEGKCVLVRGRERILGDEIRVRLKPGKVKCSRSLLSICVFI